MKQFLCVVIVLASVAVAWAAQIGPWDMAALSKVPQATFGEAREQIQEVYYAGEILKGKPTRVLDRKSVV
jgi:hypothetical protein